MQLNPFQISTVSPSGFEVAIECFGVQSNNEWQIVATGTGASWVNSNITSASEAGVITGATGSTATGFVNIGSTSFSTIALTNGLVTWKSKLKLNQLSTAVETFVCRNGILKSLSGVPNDGVFFRYTDSVNSGRWEAVCRIGGVETAVNTGILGDLNYHKFDIQVNNNATSVKFLIDNSIVNTITTNIPTSATFLGFGSSLIKSVGVTSVSYSSDYYTLNKVILNR